MLLPQSQQKCRDVIALAGSEVVSFVVMRAESLVFVHVEQSINIYEKENTHGNVRWAKME